MSTTQQNYDQSDEQPLDYSLESASPFSNPNGDEPRARTLDGQPNGQGRDLTDRNSDAKRGEKSGRPLGTKMDFGKVDSQKSERLRKRDEEILTWDEDRDGFDESDENFQHRHTGAGVETDGSDRIRSMTINHLLNNFADRLAVCDADHMRAKTLVGRLDEEDTAGHNFESIVVTALVIARDERVTQRLNRMVCDVGEPLQTALESLSGAETPAERWRVLNNLRHVTDDERVQSQLQRRLIHHEEFNEYITDDQLGGKLAKLEWSS